MSCDPNTLLEDAKCILGCLPPGSVQSVEIFLLCRIALNNSPNVVGGGTLAHWWLADDLAGLGLVNNDKVGAVGREWIDRIAGVKGSQSINGLRPRYFTGVINGKGLVQFQGQFGPDGSQQSLDLAPSFSMNGDFTTVVVLQTQIIPNTGEAFDHLSGTTGAGLGVRFTTPGNAYNAFTRINAGINQHFASFGSFVPTTAHCVFNRRIGSAQSSFLNAGARQDLALSGNMTINRVGSVLSDFGHDIRFNVAELIHYTSGLSDSEVLTLYNAYLKPRYALP